MLFSTSTRQYLCTQRAHSDQLNSASFPGRRNSVYGICSVCLCACVYAALCEHNGLEMRARLSLLRYVLACVRVTALSVSNVPAQRQRTAAARDARCRAYAAEISDWISVLREGSTEQHLYRKNTGSWVELTLYPGSFFFLCLYVFRSEHVFVYRRIAIAL